MPSADPDRAALRALRLENALRAEELRARALDRAERRTRFGEARGLVESLSLDWVTPYAELLDLTRRTGDPITTGPASYWQRRRGRNWPIYQTEQELALLRAPARVLLATNTYAQGMVHGLSAYVISTGCTYRVASRQKGKKPPPGLVEAAQRVVDETLRRNQWHGGEQPALEPELFERSLEDGEFVLCHYPREDGWTDFRTQEPEQLTQPPGSDDREFSFGVLTPADDVQCVKAYYIQHGDTPTEGEEYDADHVTHYRRNVRRSMKRGITEFCFDAFDAISLAGKLRTNLSDGAAQQAAIVGVRQHDSGSQDEVQAFIDGDADLTQTDHLTGRQRPIKLHRRGSWEDIPKGMNYVNGPGAGNAPAHLSVLQACLRGAVVKWNGFEWLISADASNNNYASSLTAESPFVRRVLQEQRGYREAFWRPVWFALRHYVETRGLRVTDPDTGLVRVYEWEEVEAWLDLLVEAPSPETRNKLEDANRASIEIPLGVQSRQAYAQEQGRDFDQLDADNQQYDDEHGPPGGDLPTEPAPAPGPPLTESLLESVGVTDGELWIGEAAYRQLSEADRSGLVKKVITNKTGKKQTVWVRPDTAAGADRRAADPADHPAAKAVRDPASLTADDVKALAEHTKTLSREQLRQLALAMREKVGGTKAALADRILTRVRAQARAPVSSPAPAPKAAPAAPARSTAPGPRPVSRTLVGPPTPPRVRFVGTMGDEYGDALPAPLLAKVTAIVGKEVSAGTLAAAGTGVDGTQVNVDPHGGNSIKIRSGRGSGYFAIRTISRDRRGRLHCHNDLWKVEKDGVGPDAKPVNPDLPRGADLLANQVRALREMGVEYIDTYAAGNARQALREDGFVGYKVWPKLGYDGTIDLRYMKKLPPELKSQMGDSRSILKLYETEAGQKWWAKYGGGMDMKFDLTDGSPSMKALEKYLADRDAKKAPRTI
jgi:hypothetical protein